MKQYIEKNLVEVFENWVVENGQSLLRFIQKQLRNKELSEDIYQEVLISSFMALPRFEYRANMKSWIYKIALNKCKDYWRKQKSAQRFWEEKVYVYEADRMIPSTEEYVVKKCSTEEMIETINELPVMYKEPLFLFYYKDWSLIEISTTKNIPLSTIKTRMRRAKGQLKDKVAN